MAAAQDTPVSIEIDLVETTRRSALRAQTSLLEVALNLAKKRLDEPLASDLQAHLRRLGEGEKHPDSDAAVDEGVALDIDAIRFLSTLSGAADRSIIEDAEAAEMASGEEQADALYHCAATCLARIVQRGGAARTIEGALDLRELEERAAGILRLSTEANSASKERYEDLKVTIAALGIEIARRDVPRLLAALRSVTAERDAVKAETESIIAFAASTLSRFQRSANDIEVTTDVRCEPLVQGIVLCSKGFLFTWGEE